MIDIILAGANGAMGKMITSVVNESEKYNIIAGLDINTEDNGQYPIYSSLKEFNKAADVIIDFSNPASLEDLLQYSKKYSVPLVLSSTGYSDEQTKAIEEHSKTVPVLMSGNMSLGINVLLELINTAMKALSDFDIEIIEKHHNKKVDSPSGTAYMLANEVANCRETETKFIYGREGNDTKRQKEEIAIHAVRGGTIVGEHSVIFAGLDEVIEIKHTAMSKKVFATGSLTAGEYISKKAPGLYSMKDLFRDR